MGQIRMKAQPAAAIGRQGGRGGGGRGGTRGGGEWTEGEVALASFRVGGGVSSCYSSVLQASIGGGEGAAWLLARGAPLRV